MIPTAPTYARDSWRPTAGEIHRFCARSKKIGLEGVNAWSWDYARVQEYRDLWDAIVEFKWGTEDEGRDEPERRDIVDKLIIRMNRQDPEKVSALYQPNAAHVTGRRTVLGKADIQHWYSTLFSELLPNATFEVTGRSGDGGTRHFTWRASSRKGAVKNGSDTLGLRDGLIQYHYTYFTIV